MEHKQFVSDDLSLSPHSNQGFQADRFTKKTNQLNIPDTIPENCSAEISGDSLKMEAHKLMTDSFNSEDKENICCNQQAVCNDSLNNSTNIAIDNSYIRQCERKLLEISNIEDERSNEFDNKSLVNSQLLKVSRKYNDTVSTPPSLLRKEISMLRTEMAEAHEFHDFEIQLLKEEKFLNEVDTESSAELLEKYSTLMELYTALKASYDEYRKAQEKIGREFQSKTADCLESLCSQIEASDGSLNFSSASFVSFTGGIRSSTMMEDASEVEATVLHEATVLAKDPLSITTDGGFKTPMQTPLKSAKKLFPQELNSTITSNTEAIDAENKIHLLNLESALYDKIKEVKDLEQRLFKVEDMSLVLQNEFERISSVYATENNTLKENLAVKTEQLNDMTQKLFTETISLNPSLRESLTDASGKKLLLVFIETIMEKCEKIKGDDSTMENLQKQLEDSRKSCEKLEDTILTRDEEIRMLQSHLSNVRQTREDLASAKETISDLESRLTLEEAEKKAAESRCAELEAACNCKDMKMARDAAENEVKDLNQQVLELGLEIDRLKKILESVEEEKIVRKSAIKDSESEIDVLKKQKEEMTELNERLKEKLESLEKDSKNVLNVIAEVRTHLDSVEGGIEDMCDLPADRVTKLFEKLIPDTEMKESKILTEFLETMIKTCRGVEKELMKNFDTKTSEWESQKYADIENLQWQIQCLNDKNNENEVAMTQTQLKLTEAEEAVLKLKSQLASTEVEKTEIEVRVRKLEEDAINLQTEIENKEMILKELDELKIVKGKTETENDDLKRQILELGQHNERLNKIVEAAEEEQMVRECTVKDSQTEVEQLKKEKEDMIEVSERLKEKLESVEKDNQRVLDVIAEVRIHLDEVDAGNEVASSDLPCDRIAKLVEKVHSDTSEMKESKILTEFLETVIKTCKGVENELLKKFDGKKTEWENQKQVDIENLQQQIEFLKDKNTENEDALTRTKQELTEADETIAKLKTELSSTEIGKDETELRVQELKEQIVHLQTGIDRKETITKELEELKIVKEKIENENGDLKRQILELGEEIKLQIGQLSESEETIMKLKSQLLSTEVRKDETELRVQELKEQIVRLQTEIDSKETILKELEELKIVKEKIENENEDLKQQILELGEEIKLQIGQLSESEETIMKLKSQLSSTEVGKDETELRVQELKEQIVRLQTEIDSQETITKELEELKIVKEKIENENGDLKRQMLELGEEIKRQIGELTEAEETILKLKSQLSSTEDQKVEIEIQVRKLEENNAALQSEIESKEAVLKDLEEMRIFKEKIENENGDLKQQIVELGEEIKRQIGELTEAEETILKLKSQLSLTEDEKVEIELRVRKLEENTANLQTEIESKEAVLKELEELKIVRERIENENGDLKRQIQESEEVIVDLKIRLEVAEEEQPAREARMKDSETEIEQLKKEKGDMIEMNERLREKLESLEKDNQKVLDLIAEVRTLVDVVEGGIGNASFDLPDDRVTKLVEKVLPDLTETKETKILTELVETVIKTCKAVENELTGIFDSKKSEWESQKHTDIQNLQQQINSLNDKNTENEDALTRTKQELTEADETILKLKSQLTSTEIEKTGIELRVRKLEEDAVNLQTEIERKKTILKELDEVKIVKEKIEDENEDLKKQLENLQQQIESVNDKNSENEVARTRTRQELTEAEETILKLKSQLSSAEVEKEETELRVRELEQNTINLQAEIENKEAVIKELEELKIVKEKIENANGDLKQQVLELGLEIDRLKKIVEAAEEEQIIRECTVKDSQSEIDMLKKQKEDLIEVTERLTEKLENLEKDNQNVIDVIAEVRTHVDAGNEGASFDLPGDRIKKVVEKVLPDTTETKILTEFVDTLIKTCRGVENELMKKFDSKKTEWENQKDIDIQNLRQQINSLNDKNNENEVALTRTRQELTEADETIVKLKTQLSSTEVEKVEVELRVRKLEENTINLQTEIETKETILKGLEELQIVREKTENENGDLKRQILESEEVIVTLKKSLEIAKEEKLTREARIKDSETEIELLKKEKESWTDLTERFENLEKNNKNLMDVFAEVQTHLDMPENTLSKLLSGKLDISKTFGERIDNLVKSQTEGLKSENRHLKLGNDNLKEKVKQLTQLIREAASEAKEELSNLNESLHSNSLVLRSKVGRKSDLCARRLDKLEEINHNLSELITRMLTMTEFPDSGKLKLYSVRDFPSVMKKVVAHMTGLAEKMKEVKEENAQLDEECETYAKIIKDLKKEAATVWKTNKEKTEEMEAEIGRLKEEKSGLEKERLDLLAKISKLDADIQKLKSSKSEGAPHSCGCGSDSKKINELKRTILVKEQKLLELQDLEAQTSSYKSQIEYLKNALEREKKKIAEEKDKNKKLQNELNEATKNQKTEEKKGDENQVLDELRMRGSLSGGIVQEFVDKEKMRKLAKDIGILKELCRARYAEIKRLEAVNAALRNNTPKNSNQMDSPIRTRGYNTRSKVQPRDLWKTELTGKENSAV